MPTSTSGAAIPCIIHVMKEIRTFLNRKGGPLEILLMTVLLLLGCYVLNTFFIGLFAVRLPATTAIILTATMICPAVEEYAKRIATLKGFPYLFAAAISVLEIFLYCTSFATFLARLLPTSMHMFTAHLHKKFHAMSLKDPEWTSMSGFYLAFVFHSLYNLTIVLSQIYAINFS